MQMHSQTPNPQPNETANPFAGTPRYAVSAAEVAHFRAEHRRMVADVEAALAAGKPLPEVRPMIAESNAALERYEEALGLYIAANS